MALKTDPGKVCPSCNSGEVVRKLSIPSLIFWGLACYSVVDTILRYVRRQGEGVYTGIFAVVLFGIIGLVLWPSSGFRCKKCGERFNPKK